MKVFIYFLSLLCFSSAGCQNNELANRKKEEKSTYLSSPMPYTANNFKANLLLPDSLSSIGKGNALLDIFIDEKGQAEGFNLTFLKLVNSDLDTFRYYKHSSYLLKPDEYPIEIQGLIEFFGDYVSGLQIVKKENVPVSPNVKYLLRAPIKLK